VGCLSVVKDVCVTREKLLKTNQKEERLSNASGVLYFNYSICKNQKTDFSPFPYFTHPLFFGGVRGVCVCACIEFSFFSYCFLCHFFCLC